MLEKFDQNGKAITLNFKGEDTYKTKVGGLLSLLLMIGMLYYAVDRVVMLSERSSHKDTFNEIFNNLTAIGEVTGEQMSYQVGYALVDKRTSLPMNDFLDETYFTINMKTL